MIGEYDAGYENYIDRLHREIIDYQIEVEQVKVENANLRELVRDLWLTGGLCDAIPDMRLQANGGDWRTMQERVHEALGIEVDE